MMASIEVVAATCLEEECSVDTVEDLIAELKTEAKAAKGKRAIAIKSTLTKLQKLIGSPEANKSEIEKLVFAASRSFSNVDSFKFPGEPIGYTGLEGTTTTAGKSLDY